RDRGVRSPDDGDRRSARRSNEGLAQGRPLGVQPQAAQDVAPADQGSPPRPRAAAPARRRHARLSYRTRAAAKAGRVRRMMSVTNGPAGLVAVKLTSPLGCALLTKRIVRGSPVNSLTLGHGTTTRNGLGFAVAHPSTAPPIAPTNGSAPTAIAP